jgi:hypothetical protein
MLARRIFLCTHKIAPLPIYLSRSYDFKIYNYNVSIVGSKLEFFIVEKYIFVFKTH